MPEREGVDGGRSGNDPYLIDPVRIADELPAHDIDWDGAPQTVVEYWTRIVASPLCPVGGRGDYEMYCALLVADDGRVFMGLNRKALMFHVADSWPAAVVAIASGDDYTARELTRGRWDD